MKKVRINILIPNYNKENYIRQALNSVLMQKTNHKYKIIVIDDCSTDKSINIIKKYIKKYPKKITLLENSTNSKLLTTIIRGYEQLKAEYFCVLDPDDYWISNYKLQNAINFLDNNKDFTMYITNNYVSKNNKMKISINHKSTDFSFNTLNNSVFGHTSGTVFRNVIFINEVPQYFFKAIGTKDEKIFRGDSFRNYIHLKEGKAHFENNLESVYRITNDGIWTSLNNFQKNLLNSRLFLKLHQLLCKDKSGYFVNLCWYFCKKNIILIKKNNQKYSEEEKLEFKEILQNYLIIRNKSIKNRIMIMLNSLITYKNLDKYLNKLIEMVQIIN